MKCDKSIGYLLQLNAPATIIIGSAHLEHAYFINPWFMKA
jgi:hypothetical protein